MRKSVNKHRVCGVQSTLSEQSEKTKDILLSLPLLSLYALIIIVLAPLCRTHCNNFNRSNKTMNMQDLLFPNLAIEYEMPSKRTT